jgi:hypothetical protein
VTEETESKESAEAAASGFLEALYDDPLRTETTRTGRYLIIASAICVAIVLFKVRLQSTSLVPLDFGDRVDVLPMLVSLAVLLLLASFALRAATDWLRDREAAVLVTRYIENERVKAALASARATDEEEAASEREYHEGYPPSEPDPWWEPYVEIKEAADAAVAKAENRIGIRSFPRRLRAVRKILEIGVPLVFAGVALFVSRASLGMFAAALISAFKP